MPPLLRLALRPSISCLVAVATAAALVGVAEPALMGADSKAIATGSSFGLSLAPKLERLAQLEPSRPPIVFLGDSTVISYPPGSRLPEALQVQLGRIQAAAFVVDLASEGTGPLEFFVTAAQLGRTPTDVAIVPVNLAAFSDGWRVTWSRPEGTGWIPFDRIVELMRLPVHWYGVTLDRFLFHQAIVASGRAPAWDRAQGVQALAARAIKRARARAQPGAHPLASGMPAIPFTHAPGRWDRQGVGGVQQSFGPALAGIEPGHPVLQLLRATVRELDRHGISTVAYLVPFNVEWVRSLGLYDARGMATSVRSIRAGLEADGARVLDLHALLPDRGFRDAGNHFTVNDSMDGPALVAAELAPAVAAELQRRRSTPPRS